MINNILLDFLVLLIDEINFIYYDCYMKILLFIVLVFLLIFVIVIFSFGVFEKIFVVLVDYDYLLLSWEIIKNIDVLKSIELIEIMDNIFLV